MHEAYVNVLNLPTQVLTWGCKLEDSLEHVDEIVILIPGIPGLPGFYEVFLDCVHRELERKIPVWIIGHAGHGEIPPTCTRPMLELQGNEDIFDLLGQMQHKAEFIKKYVPKNTKIQLIAHSTGAWIGLHLLDEPDIKPRLQKCYLLFPIVERMLDSPNRWTFTHIALPLYHLFGFLINVFKNLPEAKQIWLLKAYFWLRGIPEDFMRPALEYIDITIAEKVLFIMEDVMARVLVLPLKIIQKNKNLLKFYYGKKDGWVPLKYFQELRAAVPGVDAQLDTMDLNTHFMLYNPEAMGMLVAVWIRENSKVFYKEYCSAKMNRYLNFQH